MFQVVIYYHSVSELLNTMSRGKKGTIIVLYTELRILLINSVHLVDLCLVKKMVSQVILRPLMAILWAPVVVGPVVPKPLMDILSVLVVGRPSGTKASDGY